MQKDAGEKDDHCCLCDIYLPSGVDYDYGMDMLMCRGCHNIYLNEDFPDGFLTFLKHGVILERIING